MSLKSRINPIIDSKGRNVDQRTEEVSLKAASDKDITQGRGRLAKAALAGTLAVTAGIAAMSGGSSDDSPVQPDTTEQSATNEAIVTIGTIPVTPQKDEGYRQLVLNEAAASGKAITESQLDGLVEQAQQLNPNQYGGVEQPRVGELINLPNIAGDEGVDTTPIDIESLQVKGGDVTSGYDVLQNDQMQSGGNLIEPPAGS